MLINRRNWEQLAMAALWENSCNLSQKKTGRHQIEVSRHFKNALLCKTCCNWTLNFIVLHIFPATSMLLLETWPVTLQNLKLLLTAKHANNSHFHVNLFLHQLAANPEHYLNFFNKHKVLMHTREKHKCHQVSWRNCFNTFSQKCSSVFFL